MAKTSSAFTVLAALSAGAALGSFAMTGNPETLLRSSFENALRNNTHARQEVAQSKRTPEPGSEEYWLSAMPFDGGAPVSKTIVAGDRIAMKLAGVDRQFEVSSVSEFKPQTTEIDTRDTSVRLVLVTARDAGDERARPIRFVMELDTGDVVGKPAAPAKTL